MDDLKHIPVLLKESVEYLLNGRKAGIYVDATLGGGAASEYILGNLNPEARVIGIDRDPAAIEMAANRLLTCPNFTAVWGNFRALDEAIKELDIEQIDGILMDLGVSSMQLDEPLRGFSFRSDAKLDMRMDTEQKKSAYDLVNNLDEAALRKIFYEYGEERWAGRIASRIEAQRRSKPIETTMELADLVSSAIPKKFHSRRIHPATRVFQALRIAANEELDSLKEGIEKAVSVLGENARIVVISYHSLEDRIVKHTFREMAGEEQVRIVTKKPVLPTEEEIEMNPRSRSAKMRVAEKY